MRINWLKIYTDHRTSLFCICFNVEPVKQLHELLISPSDVILHIDCYFGIFDLFYSNKQPK